MALSAGLSGISRGQPSVTETGAGERQPIQELREAQRILRIVRDDIDEGIEDLEPQDDGDGRKPRFLRGDFDANLVDSRDISNPIDEATRSRIATDLLRGIDDDLQSRKQWEEMAARAVDFLGIKYEEASAEVAQEGAVSKAFSTIMLEAALGFWANAYAEFLPADGPVKIRDDQPAAAGIGSTGGSSVNDNPGAADPSDQGTDRAALAEAFEHDYNHYLLVGDKQYYRDFSRMLWSLGPIGTEFRKVYYNPLRKLPVSEWVRAVNLIVSNEAADLSTAQRITERMPKFLQADVKRLQYMGWWLDVPLTRPIYDPSTFEKKVSEVEGIKPNIDLPADTPHEFYECYTMRDLEGFEHVDESGTETGLPLPYRFTIEKNSRQIVEIRRNWKEGDDDYRARQRYVMFGLVPGFGLYYLGFSHLLGNTQRAANALTREMIDVGMMGIFPGYLGAKGMFPRGETQIRVGPMGFKEVDLPYNTKIGEAIMPIPVKPLDPNVLQLLQKLEANGRNVSGKLELPEGEGTQNIPVGTMLAIVEQGTKVMMAVHKGLHASRAEELELLRELIAEDPTALTKNAKNPKRKEWTTQEFNDLDLVPSSDPNTPSHVHRLMRGVALAQLQQMFPGIIDSEHVLDALLRIVQIQNPDWFVLPPEQRPQPQAQPPDNQSIAAQAKIAVAQLQAQMKAHDTQQQAAESQQENASKEQIAQIDQQTEMAKAHMQMQTAQLKEQHATQRDQQKQQMQMQHEATQQAQEHQHEAALGQQQQMHEQTMGAQQQAHEASQTQMQQTHEASQGEEQRAADKEQASLSTPAKTPKRKI